MLYFPRCILRFVGHNPSSRQHLQKVCKKKSNQKFTNRLIAKIERKWACVAKAHAETGGPDATRTICPYFNVAPPVSARIRHESEGKRFKINKR